jgi:hypothetical protein
MIWEGYLASLGYNHARIKEDEDELICSKNTLGGSYATKLGYKVLREGNVLEDPT